MGTSTSLTTTATSTAVTTTTQVQPAPQQQIALTGTLGRFPYEILHHIFSFMEVQNLYPLLLTCKYTSINILTDDVLWKKFVQKYFPSRSLEDVTDFLELYIHSDAGHKKMRRGDFELTTYRATQGGGPHTAVSAHSGCIASRTRDSIFIWEDDKNGIKQIKRIPVTKDPARGHPFDLNNNDILVHKDYVFYSIENGLEVYDRRADKIPYTIRIQPHGDKSLLPRVACDGYLLCTTDRRSGKNDIIVFKIDNGEQVFRISGPYNIHGIEMCGQNFFASLEAFASARDNSEPEKNHLIQIVDFKNDKEVNSFHREDFVPGAMATKADKVFCASLPDRKRETTIVVLDTKSGEMQKIIKVASDLIYKLFPFDGMLLYNADAHLKLLKLQSEETIDISNLLSNDLTIDNYKLYSGGFGGDIAVYDFSPNNDTKPDEEKKS
jgi:hypothetical protein